jgi:hypothetical protein
MVTEHSMWMGRCNRVDGAEDLAEAAGEHVLGGRQREQRRSRQSPLDGPEEVSKRPLSMSSTAAGRRR